MRGRRTRVPHGARLKQGLSTTHPLRPDKIRVIKSRLAERAKVKPATDNGQRTPFSLASAGSR